MYSRNCPNCNCIITYKTKYRYQGALKNNSKCRSCAVKLSITPEQLQAKRDRMTGKNNPMYGKTGEQNPFYGKHHSPETIEILKSVDKSYTQTNEFKDKCKHIGPENGMYGQSIFNVWVEKYGYDKAIKLKKERDNKISIAMSGENNPMYGKPTPIGSGNGWSGWYKGWYFRSLLELSYMINIIERFNINWISAETKEYKIKYVIDNAQRTYSADFIINDKYMVEIKPKSLHNTKLVKIKKLAAEKFCLQNNLKYKITYCTKLSDSEIKNLIQTNQIQLIDRYKTKYNDNYKK